MTDPDLIRLFIEPLEQLAIRYMITGGVASVVYGDPRFTRDIDLVLELASAAVEHFASAFGGGGYYVPPIETLEQEVARAAGHFNVIHRETGLRADIYLAGDDPLHHWALTRRSRLQLEAIAIWVAPIEYVILRKLDYYRMSRSDRHLRDVASMLRISGGMVDFDELNTWLERLDLHDQMRSARNLGSMS